MIFLLLLKLKIITSFIKQYSTEINIKHNKVPENIFYNVLQDLLKKDIATVYEAFRRVNLPLNLEKTFIECHQKVTAVNEGKDLLITMISILLTKHYRENTLVIPEEYKLTIQANSSYILSKPDIFQNIEKALLADKDEAILNAFADYNENLLIKEKVLSTVIMQAHQEALIRSKKETLSYGELFNKIYNMLL